MKMEFQNIPVSEKLNQVVENSLEQIYTQQRKRRAKSWAVKGSAIAAAFVVCAFVCISNPSIAAELPLMGHIFERMDLEKKYEYGFFGDYSDIGTALEDEAVAKKLNDVENIEQMEQVSAYTKSVNGIAVTLSEIYCNDQAMYLTVQLKSETPLAITNDFWFDLDCSFDFTSADNEQLVYIQGEYIDEYTYVGLLRLDMNFQIADDEGYKEEVEQLKKAGEWEYENDAIVTAVYQKYLTKVEIPDQFTCTLKLNKLSGTLINAESIKDIKTKEEKANMSEEEWREYYKYEELEIAGPWEYTLNVKKNTEDTQVVMINDVNELGIGFEKVVKDRFEITMYDCYTDDAVCIDYFPVMLDADGILMDYGSSGSCETLAINGRDVSKVDVFLIDYYAWMDELKGDKWRQPGALTEDGRTYKELLLERCAYHKEVVFE